MFYLICSCLCCHLPCAWFKLCCLDIYYMCMYDKHTYNHSWFLTRKHTHTHTHRWHSSCYSPQLMTLGTGCSATRSHIVTIPDSTAGSAVALPPALIWPYSGPGPLQLPAIWIEEIYILITGRRLSTGPERESTDRCDKAMNIFSLIVQLPRSQILQHRFTLFR